MEENHYYPFGLRQSAISTRALISSRSNKRQFNGNEIQEIEFTDGTGLDIYDFNARTFDPQISRFWQIDPEANKLGQEIWSPYNFCLNNPILLNDVTGKNPIVLELLRQLGRIILRAGITKVGQYLERIFTVKVGLEDVVRISRGFDFMTVLAKAAERVEELKEKKGELEKSQKSLEANVKEHEEKIAEFEKDPIGNSSKEWLETATKDNPTREVLLNRAKGRIPALKGQLKKNQMNLDKVNKELKEVDKEIKRLTNPDL